MSFDAWFTLGVSVLAVAVLVTDRFPPALVMGGAVVVLLVSGIISDDDALAGFSNEAPITVAALYVLAGAAEITGALDRLTSRTLGNAAPVGDGHVGRRTLARMVYPAMAISAFIANTPLVGMLAPRVISWCRRTRRSPSDFLMPLSYAAIFGGCITVIGTSTNLVVSGLLQDAGFSALGIFEITPAGLPIALVGTTTIILLARYLLPRRNAPTDQLETRVREFTVEMEVPKASPLVGRSVADAGLRNLEGVFLVGIRRSDHYVMPVAPTELLDEGDVLLFVGNVSRVVDLQRLPGLSFPEERHVAANAGITQRLFYEAVIGESSSLTGSTLKERGFRSRYGAAVFAIHREGERIAGKLGEVVLRRGDVLILMADGDFRRRWKEHPDFLSVAPLHGETPVRREKAWVVQLVALALITTTATGILSLLEASLLTAMALLGSRVITVGEARRSIDLDIIVLMALSFGLGNAIAGSGLATVAAGLIVDNLGALGDIGILAGILVATLIMTELLSNNAAAVLMFPIAMATAEGAGLDPRAFAVVILFGASLSFLTPIGYQANTLVWGLGGYRYRDFSRLGFPLTIATIIMTLVTVPLVFPLR